MRMGNFGLRAALCALLCAFALVPMLLLAQQRSPAPATPTATAAAAPTKNSDLQIFLDKIKADKKLLVASNMELTEPEKTAFWPIYDAYQKDLGVLNDRLVKAIKAYADAYTSKTLTNDQAKKLTDEAIAIDADEAKLRSTYATKLNAALPGTKAARYLQIENKIRAALRYDMANAIPLVP
jgi:hypothetical protein